MKDTKQQFEHVIALCRDLFAKKLHDYGAAWRIMRPSSVTDQIFIKANRIRSLEIKGVSLVGEGIRPEFMAIVNYGIIGLIQLELGYAETDDMTEETALAFYDKYAKEALELMLAKNHDYDEAWRSMRITGGCGTSGDSVCFGGCYAGGNAEHCLGERLSFLLSQKAAAPQSGKYAVSKNL